MFGRRCRAVGLRPRQSEQVKSRCPHAATCSRHQRALSLPHLGDAVNHLPGGYVVQDYCGSVAIGDAIRNGQKMLSLTDEVLRKSSVDRKSRQALTQFEARNAWANRINHANGLVTGNEGNLGREWIIAR